MRKRCNANFLSELFKNPERFRCLLLVQKFLSIELMKRTDANSNSQGNYAEWCNVKKKTQTHTVEKGVLSLEPKQLNTIKGVELVIQIKAVY